MIGYYVSIIRSAQQRGLLLGPYRTHDEALGQVERGRSLARQQDLWSEFDAFGTARVDGPGPLATGALGD